MDTTHASHVSNPAYQVPGTQYVLVQYQYGILAKVRGVSSLARASPQHFNPEGNSTFKTTTPTHLRGQLLVLIFEKAFLRVLIFENMEKAGVVVCRHKSERNVVISRKENRKVALPNNSSVTI